MERAHDAPGMPHPGWEVYTADAEMLGRVKEVRGGYFALDIDWAPDFWLSRKYIRHCEEGLVRLSISKNEAGEHRLRKPGLEPAMDPDRAGIQDAVLNESQALDVRERMERELLQQRGTIDTGLVNS